MPGALVNRDNAMAQSPGMLTSSHKDSPEPNPRRYGLMLLDSRLRRVVSCYRRATA